MCIRDRHPNGYCGDAQYHSSDMGDQLMISDPLTVITIVPLIVSLALLILPKISGSAEGLARASRAISMGVSLAMLAITTMIFFGEIGNVDWTDYNSGYSLTNDAFALIPSIGVHWKVGADALSFPMIWLTTLLIPISMLVEWDAKKGLSLIHI